RAVDYLFGHRAVIVYRWLYVIFIVVGALHSLDDVINFCDAANGLMALPNLVALLVLSPVVLKMTGEYFKRYVN
ncbi:MAG: alanine:cation symporter family protein, partial [Candidatus Obscuribacterales bacterium]